MARPCDTKNNPPNRYGMETGAEMRAASRGKTPKVCGNLMKTWSMDMFHLCSLTRASLGRTVKSKSSRRDSSQMLPVSRTRTYMNHGMNHIWTIYEPMISLWIGIKNPEAVADVCVRKHGDGKALLVDAGSDLHGFGLLDPHCSNGPVWTVRTSQVYNQNILDTWNILKYQIESDILILKCCCILRYFVSMAGCSSSAPFANVEQDFVAHPGTANWPLSGLWFFPFLWDATKIENLTFLILRVKVFGRSCNETFPCLSEVSLDQIAINVYNTSGS